MANVLLVDGDLGTQAVLQSVLSDAFFVRAASSASDAIVRLHSETPHLVVLDVADPDGVMFLRVLRAAAPKCAVLLVTASTELGALREMATLGIAGLLRKPLDVQKLMHLIDDFLPSAPRARLRPRVTSLKVARALEYVLAHMATIKGVRELGDAVGASPSHLARLFQRELGVSVKGFLTKVKVEASKQLLRETGDKIETIAEAIGFCDASHLSRVFRRHTGLWPRDYRLAVTAPVPPARPPVTGKPLVKMSTGKREVSKKLAKVVIPYNSVRPYASRGVPGHTQERRHAGRAP